MSAEAVAASGNAALRRRQHLPPLLQANASPWLVVATGSGHTGCRP